MSRDYHRGSIAFRRGISAYKWSRIESTEASNSFIYKTRKTKFDLSTDRQHDSSVLFIKHGRHPEQTFNRNLKKIRVSSQIRKYIWRQNIYPVWAIKQQTGNPNTSWTHRIETLPNCFQTNLQSFRETIVWPVYFQTFATNCRDT